MANNIIKRVWNQGSMTPIEDLQGSAFTNENGGHTFQISGVDSNGESLALSGTIAASFLRPDQTTVGISGSVSGGVASVTLSAECYGIPGRFGLVIFLTSDGKKTAIYSCVGNVARSSTDAVAPGVVADVVDLINEIEAAVGTIPASYSALMADIAPTYSSSALYAVGDYAWYDGDLKRCIVPITVGETYTPAHWTSAVVGDDVCALKSAFESVVGMDGDANLSIPSSSWTLTGGIAAGNGNNYTASNLFRLGFTEITHPIAFDMSDADYEYTIWTYSAKSQSSTVYSPSGKAYTRKKTIIYPTDTAIYFRVGFRRVDQEDMTTGKSDQTSDEYKVKHSIRFWQVTDKTLTMPTIPADSKSVGDALNEVNDEISAVRTQVPKVTTIRSYSLSADYSGEDYTVISDKVPGASGWVNDTSMVTILLPDSGLVQRVTVFRNNNVYSCGNDGVIISTWEAESVADSSVSYGRKSNGIRSDYIAYIISKTHIASSNYNAIVTNTGEFYTPFIEKGATVIFKDNVLQSEYDLKLPNFTLGNVHASGDPIASTTRSIAPWMNIPKGTVIDTSCTAVNLMIFGVSATEYIHVLTDAYISSGRRYTFAEDTYCILRFDIGTWQRPNSAPTFSTPTQAQYFIRYILQDEIKTNQWNGKIWYSYGTSISDIGVNETNGNHSPYLGQWVLSVDALSGMTRTNGAIGSGSIMPGSSSGGNVKAAILQCPYDVDLVTLELGPNDNYWDYLGTVGDTGDDTFLGNLYQIYDYLTKNTRALVVFVGIGARQLTGSTSNIVPANGEFRTRYKTMLDAVKKLSDLFGIPVIDADANACNLNHRIKGVVMADYIHYTYLGGEIYGRYVWSQLKNMKPYYHFEQET